MCTTITADRGFTWSDEETSLLLQLWGANDAQSELTGNKRNFPVYEKISESMSAMGYMRTASQCREKIKRMKREYSLTKQHCDKRTGPKKNMRFFEQFHKILLEKSIRLQENSVLQLSSCTGSKIEDIINTNKRTWNINTDRKVNNSTRSKSSQSTSKRSEQSEKDDDSPWAPDVLLVEGDGNPDALFENPLSPSIASDNGSTKQAINSINNTSLTGPTSDPNKAKILSSELPYLKTMIETLTLKLMKYQTESDARILSKIEELENERTAMDERMHKMWLDFEEKRRNEEREHELNIMKIFQDIVSQLNVNNVAKE